MIIVVTMVMVILLQRNSSDGLSGLGGGGASAGSIGQTRGSANPLTKATAILATLFVCTSLTLAYLANAKNVSVLDEVTIPERETKTQVPFLLDESEVKKALEEGEKPSESLERPAVKALEDGVKDKVEEKADPVSVPLAQ